MTITIISSIEHTWTWIVEISHRSVCCHSRCLIRCLVKSNFVNTSGRKIKGDFLLYAGVRVLTPFGHMSTDLSSQGGRGLMGWLVIMSPHTRASQIIPFAFLIISLWLQSCKVYVLLCIQYSFNDMKKFSLASFKAIICI